jgi:hypothetical protein
MLGVLLNGCASPARMGMVKDPYSGIQLGSVVEKNLFVDSSQFQNRTIKVTTRNTSGDPYYNLDSLTGSLKQALYSKGYSPTDADSFGIKLDLNVLYSGQVQRNLSSQFSFLGASAGGISGYRSNSAGSTFGGIVLGATIGSILGSYVTEDTYIIIAEVSIGVTDNVAGNTDKKTITFGSSPKMQEEVISKNFRPFREMLRTKVSVFAGGTNTAQHHIAEQVRQRLIGIVGDAI